MKLEAINSLLNSFLSDMVENPLDLAALLLMVLFIFWFFRKVTGNSSRENWFKETRLRAIRENQEITASEEMFLKSRIYFRWIYWSLSFVLLFSLPLTYELFLVGFRRYGPVLWEHWYVLIGVYLMYRLLSMLNAYMNLKLSAKEIEKERH